MKITKGTIVRTIMMALVIINLILKALGKPILDIDEGTVAEAIETLLEIAVIAVGFWKNNSFSQKARIADEYLQELRSEEYGAETISFDKFLQTFKIGKSYDYNGTYKGECVSLVKNYIEQVLGIKPQSIGNAKEYWLKRKLSYIKDNFELIGKGPAQRGDIFVRTSGTYGHVGIVISADANGFFTIEQNAGGSRVVSNKTHKYAEDIHFIRPKNQKNIEKKVEQLFQTNAKMLADSKTYADNKRTVEVGSVKKGEAVKLLAMGKTNAIIQYSTGKNTYKVGIVLVKDVKEN